MSEEEFNSLLIPGAKLEAFEIDPDRLKEIIKDVEKRQDDILRLKIVTQKILDQIINI